MIPDNQTRKSIVDAADLRDQVERNIGLRRLIADGQRVMVAVSGGLDSMVLLRVLSELAGGHGWRLSVAHFNHQLRGRSSGADERLVRRVAKELGLPIEIKAGPVRAHARRQGVSVEMAARELRHDFLACVAQSQGVHTVALAHHADDQVELFFLRLLRGSGGEGLAGMKWRNPSPGSEEVEIIRPLLDVPKAALLEYALRHKVPFREDATNASLEIQRNRVRHELLPLLEGNYQPALRRTVTRVMDILREEAGFAGRVAREWNTRFAQEARGKRPKIGSEVLRLESAAFEGLPIAVQRRSIQIQLLGLGVAPDFETVEHLRLNPQRTCSVTLDADGRGKDIPPAMVVRDLEGRVELVPLGQGEFTDDCRNLRLDSAEKEVTFAGVRIRWNLRPLPSELVFGRKGCEWFDAGKVGDEVILRHWAPGDVFRPIGMTEEVKLQDLFTNCKIPRRRRHELLVAATAAGDIFWIEGLRISERFKLTAHTKCCLHWRWKRG